MSEPRFDPRGYLRFDLAAGLLASRDDRRHLVLPASVLEAADDEAALAEASRQWGEEQGRALVDLSGGASLGEAPEPFLTDLAALLATLGWGRCELEAWGGVLFVVVEDPPAGAAAKVLAGLLAGVFDAVSGERFACVPMQEGRFLLLAEDGVAPVRRWVEAGARPGEVVSRMRAGEHLEG